MVRLPIPPQTVNYKMQLGLELYFHDMRGKFF